MKALPQHLEDRVQRYVDGTLTGTEKTTFENLCLTDSELAKRVEEVMTTDGLLKSMTASDPSSNFTASVMSKLRNESVKQVTSIRSSMMLMVGIVLILLMAAGLSATGVFDGTTALDLNEVAPTGQFLKENLPVVTIDGKVMMNVIIMLNIAVAFVVLDRAIFKPFFQKRAQSGQ